MYDLLKKWGQTPPIMMYMVFNMERIFLDSRIPDSRYFRRAATYDRMDGHYIVTDPNAPRVITLDPWLEIIWQSADGQKTVGEFIDDLKSKEQNPTKKLTVQTKQFISTLCAEGILELSTRRAELPYYLRLPQSEQDREIALKEMQRDGFIRPEIRRPV